VTEPFEPADEMASQPLGIETVEVVRAEVRIGAALVKDVVGGDQDGVTDGDDGAALAAARGEAAILGGEVGPLGARGRPSGLDERAA